MELNFYTLCVIYLVYSFLGWVAETVVATIKGRAFVNRGVASGPFCFVYGTAAVLMAVGFADLRSTPVALFLGCAANATVVEWVTAKLLERMHRRRWWDYSDKKFNLDGYVCLQYSVLWGLLGMASVLWGNVLLLRLCALLPGWLLHIGVWAAMTLAVLDQLGAALAVNRYAAAIRGWNSSTSSWKSTRTSCVSGSSPMWKSVSSGLTRPSSGPSRLFRKKRP